MFDAQAIKAISQADSCTNVRHSLQLAIEDGTGLVLAPSDFKLHDLENMLPHPRRMTGKFKTQSLGAFIRFVDVSANKDSSRIFVEPEDMSATAIIDYKDGEKPGHRDYTATFKAERTPELVALFSILDQRRTQQSIVEFCEDWLSYISFQDADGLQLDTKRTLGALRSITIKEAREVESQVESLSQTRSAFESVAAVSKQHQLPSFVTFTCVPYVGFQSRAFRARISMTTHNDNLLLTMRAILLDQHVQQMGDELVAKLMQELSSGGIPIFMGSMGN